MPKGNPGQPKSPEHAQKIALALRGKPKTVAHRKALSLSKIGKYGLGPWTPEKSRSAQRRAVKRGELPPASRCLMDATHYGPFEYDHNGDPPYAFENRFQVQSLCKPCHVAVEANRRAGRGYATRGGSVISCVVCGREFYVSPSRVNVAKFCSKHCRYPSDQ